MVKENIKENSLCGFMMVNGQMENKMERENKFFMILHSMMGILKMGKGMEKESSKILMGDFLKDSSKMENHTDNVRLAIFSIFMMVNGKMENSMEQEKVSGMMKQSKK